MTIVPTLQRSRSPAAVGAGLLSKLLTSSEVHVGCQSQLDSDASPRFWLLRSNSSIFSKLLGCAPTVSGCFHTTCSPARTAQRTKGPRSMLAPLHHRRACCPPRVVVELRSQVAPGGCRGSPRCRKLQLEEAPGCQRSPPECPPSAGCSQYRRGPRAQAVAPSRAPLTMQLALVATRP